MENQVSTIGSPFEIGTGGLSIDQDGTLFLADFGAILGDRESMGTKILKYSPDGHTHIFAEGLSGASGNELDVNGNLYQSNIRGNAIYKISPEGKTLLMVTEGIEAPVGVTVDSEENIYVANCGGNSVQKVTKDLDSIRLTEHELLKGPNGIALDENNNIYIANFENGDVIRISIQNKVDRLATLPGENNGHLTYHDGFLYVVARGAHQVFKVSLDGTVTLFAGDGRIDCTNKLRETSSFCYPNDIKVSPDGKYAYINEIADVKTDGWKLSPTSVRRVNLEVNTTISLAN